MAKVVGDIAVVVGADISPLEKGMRKGGASVRKFGDDFDGQSKRMAKAATFAGKSIAGLMASFTVGAIAKVATDVMAAAKEIENLARLAGTNVENFQKMSYAASQYGIEQTKLADILKDVNDKIGDFLQTGAGPMADFFENIAPRVGVTADMFKRLSGPDALQLYVSSLEKAGLSSAEMTFYMEAIASDATALIPLLADSGAEMNRLGQSASDLGIILGEDVVGRTARMGEVWSKVMGSMKGAFMSFATEVLIGFDDIFNLTESSKIDDLNGKMDGLNKKRNQLLGARETATKGFSGLDPISGGAATLRHQADAAIAETEGELRLIQQQIDFIDAEYDRRQAAINRINDAPTDVPGVDVPPDGTGGGSKNAAGPTQDDLDRMMSMFATETELVAEQYAQNLEKLREYRDAELLTEQEYADAKLKLAEENAQAINRIEQAAAAAKHSAIVGAGAQIIGALGEGNEKAFKLAKAFNSGMALMDAYGAYNKVLNDPTPQPWWARLSAAAGVLSAGIATVNSIKGISSSGGGGAASAPGGGAAAAPQPTQYANITLTGDTVSTASVEDLFKQLNDGLKRGLTVNLQRA